MEKEILAAIEVLRAGGLILYPTASAFVASQPMPHTVSVG